MKRLTLAALLLTASSMAAQYTSYSRNASAATVVQAAAAGQASTTNWGDCGTNACAGGAGNSASLTITTGIASPSVSGSAMSVSYSSPASGNNALFWWKPGICDTCTWIKFDSYVYIPAGVANYEFDSFIVNTANNLDAMFGKQCNTISGYWQYANQTSTWTNGPIPCSLSTGVWHHLIFQDWYSPADTSCAGSMPCLHFGTITIDGTVNSWAGTTIVATTVPTGWTHTFGCQYQMDSNSAATLTEYVDNVNCWVGR